MSDQTAYDKLLAKYVAMREVDLQLVGMIKKLMVLRKAIKGKSSLQYLKGAGTDCLKFMEALDEMEKFYDDHTSDKKETYHERNSKRID